MKKILTTVLVLMLSVVQSFAVPVYPFPLKVTQPDGTELTLVGHGDEFYSYITTLDGYTLIKGSDNFYRYAVLKGSKLVSSDIVARDKEMRSASDIQFLSTQQTHQQETMPRMATQMRPADPAEPSVPLLNPNMDLSKFRGLVILVNFNDRQFMAGENTKQLYEGIISQEHYEGFADEHAPDGFVKYTGSVRDYFRDNSMGLFNPEFDVVGPVDIDYSQYYANKTTNALTLVNAALSAADPLVDFSQYDADNDGVVDMFYIVFAGFGSNYQGNDTRLLWPHQHKVSNVRKDGVKLETYACSVERFGLDNGSYWQLEGIGTIVHEFSHILGYMDHYDSQHNGTPDAHEHPDKWDVMAAGSYLNTGITPVGYSAFERMSAGFLSPKVVSDDDLGTLTLRPVNTDNECYLIKSEVDKEYFMLENRQKTGWDEYLPGHGMLVWRVDSTNVNAWRDNRVNAYDRSYLQIRRAQPQYNKSGVMTSTGYDTYPGTGGVTTITNNILQTNLRTYEGTPSPYIIKDIDETDGVISFTLLKNEPFVVPDGYVLYEEFSECSGKGGNDGIFNSNVVLNPFIPDMEGWTYNNGAYGCKSCALFGEDKVRGDATTPAFELKDDKYYELTFRVAPYYTDSPSITLSIDGEGAVLCDTLGVENTTHTIALQLGDFKPIRFSLTGSGTHRLQFKGAATKSYRFILDDVKIAENDEPSGIVSVPSSLVPTSTYRYNLSGQRVDASYRGIVIVGGKRIIQP